MHRALALLGLPVLASAPLAQTLHVVDDDGGAGVAFTDLPAAIAAAASGDALLVKPGSYSGFTLAGKSLVVTAETDLTADVGPFTVTGIGAGQRVVLRGLDVGPGATGASRLENSAGWIGLEDCNLNATTATDLVALEVNNCAAVELVRCDVLALGDSPTDASDGIAATNSFLHLFGTTVQGAGATCPGVDGGDGIRTSGGFLFLGGTTVLGGMGGPEAAGTLCIPPGDGGNGVVVSGSQTVLQGAALLGGTPGTSAACPPGAPGQPSVVGSGSLTDLGGAARSLDVETPVRMGDLAANVLTGVPGDLVVLGIGLDPVALYFPPWLGTISVSPVIFTQVLGAVPGAGSFTVMIPTPTFPSFEFVQFYEQAAFVTPAGQIVLSTPCFPALVDASF